jgi:hypothetical protein
MGEKVLMEEDWNDRSNWRKKTTMNKKPTRCTIVLKSLKLLLYSYSALHVSGTLAPIIRSFLILHIQPPFTMCRWVGCIFQLWSVTTVAKYEMKNLLLFHINNSYTNAPHYYV